MIKNISTKLFLCLIVITSTLAQVNKVNISSFDFDNKINLEIEEKYEPRIEFKFSLVLSFVSLFSLLILNIIWIIYIIRMKNYCNLMHYFPTSILFCRLALTIITIYNILVNNQLKYLVVLQELFSIILQACFLVLLFLASTGWKSIRFPTLINELKANFIVYSSILIISSTGVCSNIILKRSLLSSYNILLITYFLFIYYKTKKLTKKICSIHNFYTEDNLNSYYLCIKAKQKRLKFILFLSIAYSLSYVLLILFQYFIISEGFSIYKIFLDNISVICLTLLYKPSKIILKNHICPNKYILEKVRILIYYYSPSINVIWS